MILITKIIKTIIIMGNIAIIIIIIIMLTLWHNTPQSALTGLC